MEISSQDIITVLLANLPENISTIDDYDKPLSDYGLDSLDTTDILLALEEKYEFKIPDEHIDQLTTANNIATYTKKRLSSR